MIYLDMAHIKIRYKWCCKFIVHMVSFHHNTKRVLRGTIFGGIKVVGLIHWCISYLREGHHLPHLTSLPDQVLPCRKNLLDCKLLLTKFLVLRAIKWGEEDMQMLIEAKEISLILMDHKLHMVNSQNDWAPPPNPNDVMGTLTTLSKVQDRAQAKQTRAHEEHLRQMMELQIRAQQVTRERSNRYVFYKFRKMNPTDFYGDADPYIAEEWIKSLDLCLYGDTRCWKGQMCLFHVQKRN